MLVSSIQRSDSVIHISGLPWWFGGKESACHAGDPGSIHVSGRSPGEWNGYPLQYSYMENSMGREAWWAVPMRSQRVRHDWVSITFTIYIYIYIFRFFSIIICCKALSIVLLLFTYFMGPYCLPISYIVVYFWEKAMAPHSSTLAWKIPWTEEPGRLRSIESRRVRHDWATSLSFSLSCIGEGHGNSLQCSCLENPRDGGAWWAAVYGVTQSWTRLKRLSSSSSSSVYLLIPNS